MGEQLVLSRPGEPDLFLEVDGEGPPIVLLHGLTATRRYVAMGSTLLQRNGFQVISYDARGHGRSGGAPPERCGYRFLVNDLAAVIDHLKLARPLLVGVSMGAHTALAYAVENPERIAGLVVITPGFDPEQDEAAFAAACRRWRALADALRSAGIDGFLQAYRLERIGEPWRETVRRAVAQRIGAHRDLLALADAVEGVGCSRPPFDGEALTGVGVQAIVIGSRDQADPDHPLELAGRYASWLGCNLLVEPPPPPPRSPIAWQGGRVSALVLELARRVYSPTAG